MNAFVATVSFGAPVTCELLVQLHNAFAGNRERWIAGNVRLDGRRELTRQLIGHGQTIREHPGDSQLVLHAYAVWGIDCVNHLQGDFAFALWDAGEQRLLCARDHFGIKPFYYALFSDAIVCSNSLDCIRNHPGVAGELNTLALADFLLFGDNQDETTTSFADVRRLPPAHSLVYERRGVQSARYWRLPTDDQIRHERPDQHVERFAELLTAAVADRTDANTVGVWLSGGLDSASLAAFARDRSGAGGPNGVRALSVVYDSLVPDDTRAQATETARCLGIDLTCFTADSATPFECAPALRTTEPVNDPFFAMRRQVLRHSAALAEVWLCGEGADEILWPSRVADLLALRPWWEVGTDVSRTIFVHGRRPGFGLRARVDAWRRVATVPPFPDWIAHDLTRRHALHERWRDYWGDRRPSRSDPLHPRVDAVQRLGGPHWSRYFETFDPHFTGVGVEPRYPFLDLRLVSYALRVPPLPWCVDKELLRRVVRGKLPATIATRRKTPLAADPLRVFLTRAGTETVNDVTAVPALHAFIDTLPRMNDLRESEDAWLRARALSLNCWLRYHDVRPAPVAGTDHLSAHESARLPHGV